MVNDNQITDNARLLTHKATTLFIKGNTSSSAPPKLYDLDMEFANTKKNKSRITVVSLIIFTLLFSAAAYGVTQYIEYQNSRIPISINAFEDVNLREIFDKAKQYEKEMRDAVRDLDDLYQSRENALDQLNVNAENAIRIVEAENPKNKVTRINRIKLELNNTLETEEELWAGEIEKAKERINSIQVKIDSYDTRILEKAKEQESIINNQQQRFDIEMEKSVKYYEEKISQLQIDHISQIENINLTNKDIVTKIRSKNKRYVESLEEKYNPEFSEEFSFLSIYEKKEVKAFNIRAEAIDDIAFKEGLIDKGQIADRIKEVYQAERTFIKLKEIPYYNSPKQAIGYLEEKYHNFVDEFNNLVSNVTPLLKDKNRRINVQEGELEQLNYFLTSYVKKNRINGVIIDPRYDHIKLFIDPIYQVTDGTIGFIFRNDSDFIGTIEFKTYNGELIGVIKQLVDGERGINPFDMILIKLK